MSLTPTGVPLDDPFVADRLETVAKRLALLELMDAQGIEVAVAASEEEWRSPPSPPEPDATLSRLRDNRSRALAKMSDAELERLALGALLNMKAQAGVDLLDESDHVECRVLIVHGDLDSTVPLAFGEALAQAMPHAEAVVLDGEGHGLIVNAVAQAAVSDWLAQASISTRDQSNANTCWTMSSHQIVRSSAWTSLKKPSEGIPKFC